MNEKYFTRLEKMFIISIKDALKEYEKDIYGAKSLLIISSTKGNIDLLEEGMKDFLIYPESTYGKWQILSVLFWDL